MNNFHLPLPNKKKVLFTLVILELFLGGGGRLLEINSFLTIRMVLFMVYLTISIWIIFSQQKVDRLVGRIIFVFVLVVCYSTIIGFLYSSSPPAKVFEDIKPLLNTFLLLFLSVTIYNEEDVKYIIKLIKFSAVCLCILHFVLYGIYLYGGSDFDIMYRMITPDRVLDESISAGSTEFFFKGETGFLYYKSDLYLCIGFIAWNFWESNKRKKIIMLSLITIALILTGTRGFFVCLFFTYLIKWVFIDKRFYVIFYAGIGLWMYLSIFQLFISNIGDKKMSDEIRYIQIEQVFQAITPVSAIIGHGYGFGVEIRPEHMEIAFLEIFHKQGIVGLGYYTFLILILIKLYKKLNDKRYSVPLLMFVVFIYALSFTNPYINHPLGISIMFISIYLLNVLIKLKNNSPEKKLQNFLSS